ADGIRAFHVTGVQTCALPISGARHDLVDAVIAADSNDILQITQRVEALSALLSSEDGANLLAGYRRAANILAAEEKKGGRRYDEIGRASCRERVEDRVGGVAV